LTTPAKLDYHEALGVHSTATLQEIERAYAELAAHPRASNVLADAEGARYKAGVKETEAEEDKKNAELDAYLKRSGRRRRARNRRSGGWLDVLLDILSFFK